MSLLLTAARSVGSGLQAERAAVEPLGRIRLSRSPNMKYKCVLAPGVISRDGAQAYFRKVIEEAEDPLVRASAKDLEFNREDFRSRGKRS